MLTDEYGRTITGIRVSLTDRCNLSCFYCHREWNVGHGDLKAEEIIRFGKAASSLGIRKLRITGGEPLLCDDVLNIVSSASKLFDEVSMTTNGTLLKGLAEDLKKCGLKRVNVSLPTLSPERYTVITGKNLWEEVVGGIMAAREVGLLPVKVNMVVLKGVNDDEVERMIDFSVFNSLDLQLIELQPVPNSSKVLSKFFKDLGEIEAWLANNSNEVIKTGGRTSFKISKYGKEVIVTSVRPHANPNFCAMCSRLRITSDGKLKPCLLRNDNLVDLRGVDEFEELKALFKKATLLREPYWK